MAEPSIPTPSIAALAPAPAARSDDAVGVAVEHADQLGFACHEGSFLVWASCARAAVCHLLTFRQHADVVFQDLTPTLSGAAGALWGAAGLFGA